MMAVTDFTFKFLGETDNPENDGEMYAENENEPYADETHAEAAPLYAEDEHLEKAKAQEEEFNDRILTMADPWYGVAPITNVPHDRSILPAVLRAEVGLRLHHMLLPRRFPRRPTMTGELLNFIQEIITHSSNDPDFKERPEEMYSLYKRIRVEDPSEDVDDDDDHIEKNPARLNHRAPFLFIAAQHDDDPHKFLATYTTRTSRLSLARLAMREQLSDARARKARKKRTAQYTHQKAQKKKRLLARRNGAATLGQRDQRGGSLSVHKAFLSPSIFPPKTSAEESGGFFRGESF